MMRTPRCPPAYRPFSGQIAQSKRASAPFAPGSPSSRRTAVPPPYRPSMTRTAAQPQKVVQRVKWDTVENAKDSHKTELSIRQ